MTAVTDHGNVLTLLLCGDVMTGRGVDQILPHPVDPRLREEYVDDARTYVDLAEKLNGPIARPVDYSWPWGDALPMMEELAPDVRLINLETSITSDGDFAPGKTVHYRMSPDNIGCLTVARLDACGLANNHVLDFGPRGLDDTLDALARAGLHAAGAGRDADAAARPAILSVPGDGRVLFSSGGMESSGVPRRWAATTDRAGVSFVPDLSNRVAAATAARACELKRPGDIVVVSLHWGSNWGYRLSAAQVRFARRLIDGGVDIVFGHSSHHPRPLEVYRRKLILYGCGDVINDYEGIRGHEAYRDDLRLLYLASVDVGSGHLTFLRMLPMQARNMRLRHASTTDVDWLRSALEHTSRQFTTRVDREAGGTLALHVT
ncbi:CapA family protein [Actinomycetospora cinnamomea]|uniref:Poly-gamma-glutamate synthesis protein (Capsule biosynthesis protein) n=1 Tax=Actinomycetospora cinnamomea TaxID=663609 RepID=A0A2U1EZK5_9PSEU|nr:CapA family protein [Actinomycetospora cinnamomea]PVZ05329.1 poly-gamma-glutamate synthesis protein (capsule biosynthesis protein) [Actinomycetospora cinnamomea]